MESSKNEGLHLSQNKRNASFNDNIKPNSHRLIPTTNTKRSKLYHILFISSEKCTYPYATKFIEVSRLQSADFIFPYLQSILK